MTADDKIALVPLPPYHFHIVDKVTGKLWVINSHNKNQVKVPEMLSNYIYHLDIKLVDHYGNPCLCHD